MYIHNDESSACIQTDPLNVVKTLYQEWIKQEFKVPGSVGQSTGGTFIFKSDIDSQIIRLTDYQIRMSYSFDDLEAYFGNTVELVEKIPEVWIPNESYLSI